MIPSKINILDIVRGHIRTLCHASNGKLLKYDLFFFYATPAIISIVFCFWKDCLSSEVTNALIAVFSIFSGLLLNLLVLLIGIISKARNDFDKYLKILNDDTNTISALEQRNAKADSDKSEIKLKLLKETYYNLSYAVVISICTLASLLICYTSENSIRILGTTVAVYLTINFALTLFMILKRIHIILKDEFLN
jgi:hypothetical protein|tara:strand:+ start:1051 stop:1632 length:582 start_codon:yes stop_codon:yes gene_type:complete